MFRTRGQIELSRRLWIASAFLVGASLIGLLAGLLMLSRGAAPWILAAPLFVLLVVVLIGVGLLRKTVGPLARLEGQLVEVGHSTLEEPLHLLPIYGLGPADKGWNRLVEDRAGRQLQSGLHQRLAAALEAFGGRKSQQVLQSLSEGVAVTDAAGLVTFANGPLAALVGGGEDTAALVGRPLLQCLGLAEEDSATRRLSDPEAHLRPLVVEIPSPADREIILRVARGPLRDDQGRPGEGHVWSVRDVTQQKLAEQMRNQFVGSATHELRTPLANIKAYAETLALSEMLDIEQQKEFCNIINAEATRLARLIDDLLSISSMEVGSLTLTRSETDMERLLRETIDKARPQLDQKQIALETSLPARLPKMHLDKDKISVTLVNLLGNAAKYTPEKGDVVLKVEVSDRQMLIHVQDSGIGIAPEELPKVFDKFFRSADDRVQKVTGTGLGLSLAGEIVRLHGGKLSVKSELDKGSTFTVALPLG